MTIEQILELVPDYQEFYTVDELDEQIDMLAAQYPDTVEVSIVGYSRQNHPIRCMKMGTGEKNALCFACPHPNEPIGAMTLITLGNIFSRHPEVLADSGFTWYLIPCIDPDGTRLNEGWFKGPYTLLDYARNFYRPPGNKQVEWTFPINIRGCKFNDPLPETKAVMKLIDELKPRFMFSLHNSAYGGAYWYLTENDPELCVTLENAAKRQQIPLHLGEPECFYITKYSDAVHSMMSVTAYVNYMIKTAHGVPETSMQSGGCSADYVDTVCKCQTMLAEIPYFFDPRIADNSDSDITRKEALLENIRLGSNNYAVLGQYWAQVHHLFKKENPFYEFVDSCIEGQDSSNKSKRTLAESAESERKAKVSEVFDNLYGMRVFECLNVGLAIRACDYELEHSEDKSVTDMEILSFCRSIFDKELEQMCAWLEKHAGTEVISIRRLVSVQLESALQATNRLKKE